MPKILYFVDGVLTPDDAKVAEAVGASIRNPIFYREGDGLEECDGVMGKAPQAYIDAFGLYKTTEDKPVKDK